jgi:hypothetical protein
MEQCSESGRFFPSILTAPCADGTAYETRELDLDKKQCNGNAIFGDVGGADLVVGH